MQIFAHDTKLYSHIDEKRDIAYIRDYDDTHIVYMPLFADYRSNVQAQLAQDRDIADLFRAHYYAAQWHEAPVHCMGHSRGAGALISYLGILWRYPSYLVHLAHTHWMSHAQSDIDMHVINTRVKASVGSVCVFATFDNIEDVIEHVASSCPRWLRRRLIKYPRWSYSWLRAFTFVPYYDMDTTMTPRSMVQFLPAHVPCIFVHAADDPLIPASVTRDLSRIRSTRAPHTTTCYIVEGVDDHVSLPYAHDMSDIASTCAYAVSN